MNQHEIAEQLRQLSRMYVHIQKERIKIQNMLESKFQYVDKPDLYSKLRLEEKNNLRMEYHILKEMEKIIKEHPYAEWFEGIKGVGHRITDSIIGEIDGAIYGSIEKDKKVTKSDLKGFGRKFPSTADLWSYAGYSVENGVAKRRKRGEAYNCNKYLKQTMFQFSESQIKARGNYRELYDTYKKEQTESHPELTKKHVDNRAKRRIIKKFLSDFRHQFLM